jgi:lipopolysaccharide transport system ATP-binding protein
MSDIAIRVEGLKKSYQLGGQERHAHGRTIRETLTSAVGSWFSRNGRAAGKEILWALNDVSFEVKRGEIVGIVGRNGAGKSTLLKILARITAPTSGVADIRGRVGALLEIGTGFHPELTGRDNIYLSGAILGMKKRTIDEKFDQMVAFAELEKFIDTAVKHYSSGMYMRLAFSVAAHLDPEVLLIDEVLAYGDFEFQKKCLGKMDEIVREGRTILFVSHNLAAIAALTNRSLLLKDGRIDRDDATGAVLTRYLHSGEIDPAERNWDTPLFALRSAVIQSSSGPSLVIGTGEPLCFVFEMDVKEPVRQTAFSVMITDLRDYAVYTGLSSDDGHWTALEPGAVRIRHTVSIPLAPGAYAVSLALVGPGGYPLAALSGFLHFQVAGSAEGPALYDNRRGVLAVRGEWSIER